MSGTVAIGAKAGLALSWLLIDRWLKRNAVFALSLKRWYLYFGEFLLLVQLVESGSRLLGFPISFALFYFALAGVRKDVNEEEWNKLYWGLNVSFFMICAPLAMNASLLSLWMMFYLNIRSDKRSRDGTKKNNIETFLFYCCCGTFFYFLRIMHNVDYSRI